ncbi:dienelactone hydrolase family protein [Aeromicrobium sp. Leaf245]|uniref:dienelactone hydrolase family protein n=1 Tax=Aeromicrobium sp. Leaf245 TaxID=1736306 RepID=UPI0006F4DFD1|nr:dienelactone hydrolase family protein [Aeromicrobium sp. Leaf245]KQO36297.1 dienelactone hydrolase [Aeromicrobium sp. Leaf245]
MAEAQIEGPDGPIEAWVATPAVGEGPWPGVLLVVDAIGLRPQIHVMADRFASLGYTVLAPNVFHHFGTAAETSPEGDLREPGAREAFFEQAMPRVHALTPELSRPDTALFLDVLQARDDVADGPVGVVGYCMGARIALRAAGDHPGRVSVAAGFHGGGLVDDTEESPHLSLRTARATVLLRHADDDPSMPSEHQESIAELAAASGVVLDQAVYPGAPHGFTMADTSMYDAGAAQRHEDELREHLASVLG